MNGWEVAAPLPPPSPFKSPVEESLPRGGDKDRSATPPVLIPGRSDTRFTLVLSSWIQENKDCSHIFIHASTV